MDLGPLSTASRELSERFINLLDALSTVHTLSTIDVRSLPEKALLREALRTLMQNQDMTCCSVFLLEDDSLINATGLDWDDLDADEHRARSQGQPPNRFRIGEGIVGMAASTGALQHCPDCRHDERFLTLAHQKERNLPGSLICCPIQLSGTTLGVLNVSHPDANFFDDWHERLLSLFCNILAQLLVNCRLLHIMEEAVERRTEQLGQALQEAKELKKKYEELSFIDDLTGLHNRRFFFLETEAGLSRATRYRQPFGIMTIDVDHFKQVNDRYGHAEGDRVLKTIAGALQGQARDCDVVARIGGEEFAIGMPDTTLPGARQLGGRLLQAIQELDWPNHIADLSITISIGIACWPDDQPHRERLSMEQLLNRADQALYQSKRNGRNSLAAYPDDILDPA